MAPASSAAAHTPPRVAPQLRLDAALLWKGFAAVMDELVPVNQALLARRDSLQRGIDEWHRARRGQPFDVAAHESHLRNSGYLVEEGPDFRVGTQNVDPEISRLAGPQLVVPLKVLHEAAGLKRVIVSTYQSVSGAGKEAMDELEQQTSAIVKGEDYAPKVFQRQIAFNQQAAFADIERSRLEFPVAQLQRKVCRRRDPHVAPPVGRIWRRVAVVKALHGEPPYSTALSDRGAGRSIRAVT